MMVAAMVVLINGSCNKMLEIDTTEYLIESKNFYISEKDLDYALRGAYSIMAGIYGDNLQGRMGLEADEGFLAWGTDINTVAYYVASPQDLKISAYWRAFYNGINTVNSLLENIDKPAVSDAVRANVKGQALYLRGYFYFMLVNKFGGVPLILTSTKDGSLSETQVPRASIAEVYNQVLADMTAAADLVKDVKDIAGGGELSKSAVWGMLARVCLYMAGKPLNDTERYKDVVYWTSKVIQSGHHRLNPSYEQVFINYARDLYSLDESIWEIEFWGNGTGLYANVGGRVGINNGILNTSDNAIGISGGYVRPTVWLRESYKTGDLRKDWNTPTFIYQGNPGQRVEENRIWFRCVGKFRRESETLTPKSTSRTSQNAPVLRYSDILLMYAEALNEIEYGPTPEAYNAINQVKRRAFGLDIAQASTVADVPPELGYEDFKRELMDERARELCFEGLRKNDLVRWGLLYQNMRAVYQNANVSGTTNVAVALQSVYNNVGERDVLWPIPAYEMQLNKKLVQNPRW